MLKLNKNANLYDLKQLLDFQKLGRNIELQDSAIYLL